MTDYFNSMTQPEPSIPNFMSLSEKPEFVSADSILSFLSLAQLYPIPPPTEMSSNYEQSPLFRVLLRFHFSQNGKLADIHNHNNLHTRQPQHEHCKLQERSEETRVNFGLRGLDLGRNRRLRDPSQIGGGAMLRMRANHQLVPPCSLPISLTDTECDDTQKKRARSQDTTRMESLAV